MGFLGIFWGGLDFFDPEIVPLILNVPVVIIFMRAKHIIGDFERFFEGGQYFFDPQIFLSGFLRSVGFLCRRVSNSTNKYSIGLTTSFLVTRYVFTGYKNSCLACTAHALYECTYICALCITLSIDTVQYIHTDIVMQCGFPKFQYEVLQMYVLYCDCTLLVNNNLRWEGYGFRN